MLQPALCTPADPLSADPVERQYASVGVLLYSWMMDKSGQHTLTIPATASSLAYGLPLSAYQYRLSAVQHTESRRDYAAFLSQQQRRLEHVAPHQTQNARSLALEHRRSYASRQSRQTMRYGIRQTERTKDAASPYRVYP